jgi:hypothetical protein
VKQAHNISQKAPNAVLLFFVLLSHAAHACPDLTGTYLCPGYNAQAPHVLYTYQQIQTASGWQYSVMGKIQGQGDYCAYRFLANGEQQVVTDTVTGRKLVVQANCSDNHLSVSGTVQVDANTTLPFSEVLSLTSTADLQDQSLNSAGQTVIEVCPRQ